MGRVRLNSEYIAYDPDTIFMEGAHMPDENEESQDHPMTESQDYSEEETKDDPMKGNPENSSQ